MWIKGSKEDVTVRKLATNGKLGKVAIKRKHTYQNNSKNLIKRELDNKNSCMFSVTAFRIPSPVFEKFKLVEPKISYGKVMCILRKSIPQLQS